MPRPAPVSTGLGSFDFAGLLPSEAMEANGVILYIELDLIRDSDAGWQAWPGRVFGLVPGAERGCGREISSF